MIWDTGKKISVPQFVFPMLRERGLLIGNKSVLSPLILLYYKDINLHGIIHDVQIRLGSKLDGPMYVKCYCAECKKEEAGTLDDARPVSQFLSDADVDEVKSRRRYR